MARIGQRAENEFVGAQVGIMDQMAASLADQGTALFLDTRVARLPAGAAAGRRRPGRDELGRGAQPRPRRLQHPPGRVRARGRAARRRRSCATCRSTELPRVDALPEPLRPPRPPRRDRGRARAGGGRGDAARRPARGWARCSTQSHASMRDDYEVSVPEIDLIVELARRDPDVFGARLTGGGFGGSVVMLARHRVRTRGRGSGSRPRTRASRGSARPCWCRARSSAAPSPTSCRQPSV